MLFETLISTSSRPEVFCKKGWRQELFLNISQNSQENTLARASFSIKLQALGLQLTKKDFGKAVFLRILRNF